MTLIFDPEGKGFYKVLKDYQVEALKQVWMKKTGVTSREAWQHVNKVLKEGQTISRASIINFLNDMVDEGVLNYEEESGKGGYHRVYSPKLDESSFKSYIAETVISSLMKDFPEETKEAIKKLAA